MTFSILTCSINREFYVKKCIEAFIKNSDYEKFDFEHFVLFMGKVPGKNFVNFWDNLPENYLNKALLMVWPEVLMDGEVMERMKKKYTKEIFGKLDDDAEIITNNYLTHAQEILRINPNISFSPYPLGLINNPGGVLSNNREVKYGENTDTFYTFRYVHHLGGFCRFTPMEILQKVNFTKHIRCEDTDISNYCLNNNVKMAYLENSMCVEHQETILGQQERAKIKGFNL
jgi:hypothetical protein